MSRFLFVVPPFVGHVNPAASLARELVARGHVAAWVTYPVVAPLLPENDRFYPLEPKISDADLEAIREKTGSRWLPGLKAFWEDIIVPLGEAMLPGVREAAIDFKPDVMVVDQQALAGGVVARSLGIPWVTSSPTALLHSNLLADYPLVQNWISSLLRDFQVRAGVEPVERPDTSPELVLLYTTQSLIDADTALPPNTLLLGPVLEGRVETVEAFPWEQLQERPRVLVSLGTVNTHMGRKFYRLVIDSLKDQPLQVILKAPADMLDVPVPDNFIVREWLPQLELLKHVDAVVSHAGSTVNESIMEGLPLVVIPVAYDNFIFAQQAVKAGAAVRLRFGRSDTADLSVAVHEVLDNPQYREAARRIRDEFIAAGGTTRGADAIEQIARNANQKT